MGDPNCGEWGRPLREACGAGHPVLTLMEGQWGVDELFSPKAGAV